jgi:hypothetical protein
MPLGTRREGIQEPLSRALVATVTGNHALEDKATQTDWMGDLSGGLGSDSAAGRGWCFAAAGRAGSGVGGRRCVGLDRPPKYERAAVVTSFAPFEPRVRQLLKRASGMPATVLAERVGWTGSITWFRDNVRRLRPEHRPVDPADRLTGRPGTQRSTTCGVRPRRFRSRTARA